MPHIDPDRMALFALGEPAATPEESAHLAECATCVGDLEAFRHVARAGRASLEVGALESPPEIVWARIAEELSLGASDATQAGDGPDAAETDAAEADAAEADAAKADAAMADAAETDAAETDAAAPALRRDARMHRKPPRRRGMRRGWVLAASLVLVAAVGLGGWALTQRPGPTPDEIAQAALAPFPDHPDATGSAIVDKEPDGSLAVHVALTTDAVSVPDTFREVWLIKADGSALISLGVLDGTEQTFPIPADVNLNDFVLVDVSQEPMDGAPGHSGDSIVRGELTFL